MKGKNFIKPIAIYLPQFHPVPENDLWWGEGFTEWTNVTKAKSLYKGHYQPHLPTDLGFTDLRVPEVRNEQAILAKDNGIQGFCYYHYWFNGQQLLERPFEEVLNSGKPDFPFMLCWANETWSKRWLGEEKEILLKQTYSKEDNHKHAEYLAKVFSDQRYIKVNDRPVFIIYRPTHLDDAPNTLKAIREQCRKANGINPYIVASNSHSTLNSEKQLLGMGFDSILNFRPQLSVLPDAFNDKFSSQRLQRNFLRHKLFNGKYKVYSYAEALEFMQQIEPDNFDNVMPCVFVGWDNTARRKEKGVIVYDNTAELFGQELERVKKKLLISKNESGLLFINAWNEWAEGNHLEPDRKNGDAHLKKIKEVFEAEAVL